MNSQPPGLPLCQVVPTLVVYVQYYVAGDVLFPSSAISTHAANTRMRQNYLCHFLSMPAYTRHRTRLYTKDEEEG
jgi:hypothetical protein